MDIPAVICENLVGSEADQNVFEDVTFRLNLGQGMLVLSDPFHGAELLMRILATWRETNQGTVQWFGRTYKQKVETQLLDLRRHIAWIHPSTRLISNMSLIDNTVLGLIYHNRISFKEAYDRAEPLLRQFDLFDLRFRRPAELSHEEQRLSTYVRELAKNPRLILMEKPLVDLDQSFPPVMNEIRKRADNKEAAFIISEVSPWDIHRMVDLVLQLDGEGHRLLQASEFDVAGHDRFHDHLA